MRSVCEAVHTQYGESTASLTSCGRGCASNGQDFIRRLLLFYGVAVPLAGAGLWLIYRAGILLLESQSTAMILGSESISQRMDHGCRMDGSLRSDGTSLPSRSRSRSAAARQEACRALFRAALDEGFVDGLRAATQGGWALGDARLHATDRQGARPPRRPVAAGTPSQGEAGSASAKFTLTQFSCGLCCGTRHWLARTL
jgi:hypothetical protein